MKQEFPSDAYASNGAPWWRLELAPNSRRKFGQEKRIAAFLWYAVEVGSTFTMKDLREALETAFEDAEQLNRRLRQLRKDDWIIYSYKDDGTLAPQEYRLSSKGLKIWLGERDRRSVVSSKTRRIVLDRDGNRCVVCGVGARESYPDEPEVIARMTIGHRIPGERLGEASVDNLRTECSRCNEPVRDLMPDPERFAEVISAVRVLSRGDKLVLREWIVSGQRSRLSVDIVYDRIRQLSPAERRRVIGRLDTFLGTRVTGHSSTAGDDLTA